MVDEVLSVGDTQFQKKCLGKMEDVSREGRTVLFVSHNMDAAMRLCHTGVLLKDGSVLEIGKINDIIDSHLVIGSEQKKVINLDNLKRNGRLNRDIRLVSAQLSVDNS